jgi:hypothetical protein
LFCEVPPVPVLIGRNIGLIKEVGRMGDCYAIRKAFRKWWARNYYELLDSVVMLYLGMVLLLAGMAIFESFKG